MGDPIVIIFVVFGCWGKGGRGGERTGGWWACGWRSCGCCAGGKVVGVDGGRLSWGPKEGWLILAGLDLIEILVKWTGFGVLFDGCLGCLLGGRLRVEGLLLHVRPGSSI